MVTAAETMSDTSAAAAIQAGKEMRVRGGGHFIKGVEHVCITIIVLTIIFLQEVCVRGTRPGVLQLFCWSFLDTSAPNASHVFRSDRKWSGRSPNPMPGQTA